MESGQKYKKNPHPREKANWLSAVTFWWMLPVFFKGFRREYEESDLFETLKSHKSNKLGDEFEKMWLDELKYASKHNKTPNLLRVILKRFGHCLLGFGIITSIFELGIKMVQPIALGNFVLLYASEYSEEHSYAALSYGAILIASTFLTVFIFHPTLLGIMNIALKIRISIVSLIYRKSLRISKSALGDMTVGQMVNLLSNDISRLNGACIFCHDLWIGPLAALVVVIIIYNEIGITALFGIVYIFCYIPFQSWLGKRCSVLRLRTALKTDERLRLMNEIINGINIIKMYTWEMPFTNLVSEARRREIKEIRKTSYIRGVNLAFKLFTTRTAIFASVLVYALFGNEISAQKVFVISCCFNLLKHTMTDFFPYAIAQVAEGLVSIQRIQIFLLYDETKLLYEKMTKESKSSKVSNDMKSVTITNITAKWNSEQADNTLTDVSLNIAPSTLVALIGPVGSGKTSLFYALLKELPLIKGSIQVGGTLSYATQEAWVFAGSVRQNILFGSHMNKAKYQKVIECCALETDFALFPYGDKTMVGERGVSLSGGQRARINLARAVYKDADVYLLDDPLSAVDTNVGRQLFNSCIKGYLRNKTVILITHQLQYLKDADNIVILGNGIVEAEGNYQYLRTIELNYAHLLEEQAQDRINESKVDPVQDVILDIQSNNSEDDTIEPEKKKEHRSFGKVSKKVYYSYFKATGNVGFILVLLLLFVVSQVLCSMSDYFLTYWVNLEEYRNKNFTDQSYNFVFGDISRNQCIYLYTIIVLLMIGVTLVRSFVFFFACTKASTTLHNNMFASITRAYMRFFDTNPTGRIINRFSKDIGNIDELLPNALLDCIQISLQVIGIVTIVSLVNPWLIIPTFICFIIFYACRYIYLATSRSFKRLEGTTSSPVFSHITASLQGVTTIRAFNAQKILQNEFDNHQDLYSTTWYLYITASRAFAWWIDTFCTIYLSLIIISFFFIGNEKYGGNVGLAVTQVMGMLGIVQWGIRQSSELENQMTSVERILEYTNLECERPLKTEDKPPDNWPEYGEISFHDVNLKYTNDELPILRDVNFSIKPKEKVGIVGRTGAGKSSLLAALFQMARIEGSIFIDGVNIGVIGLHDLRSKLSIIPQEPVLFSGTIRKNLDPFDQYSDDVLWRALEDVELKPLIGDFTGGLSSKMAEGGSNFSLGQRQLVCLARTIIRNNKILVMDEATANVDPQTDALIQRTIRKKFADCTVLTIAHRLLTVMDSDKVLVMHAGKMVEFDHPHILLENADGYLSHMVAQTGPAMTKTLKSMAKKNFKPS